MVELKEILIQVLNLIWFGLKGKEQDLARSSGTVYFKEYKEDGNKPTYTLASNSTAALNTAPPYREVDYSLIQTVLQFRDISNNGYGTNGSNETQVAWCWKAGRPR